MKDEVLSGGVANAGAVVRRGGVVSRPSPRNADAIHQLLEHLSDEGFEAPRPQGDIVDGRETLVFIPGDVPIPPYPPWALTDEALESVGVLLRRYHDAVRSFVTGDQVWSTELRDPDGSQLVCHNDVCLENVVFREGEAVALLDFDYAAPGRPIWDVAMAAGMCVPIRPPDNPLPGQGEFDPFERLARFARAYAVQPNEAQELVAAIGHAKEVGNDFVQRRVDAGEKGFIDMVASQSPGSWTRRLDWFRENRQRFEETLSGAL